MQPGDSFAGHRIEGIAGRGGMGVVYRATQLDLERTVALKLIAPQLAQDPDFRDRFVRESRVAASIDHPNVIPIFYTGEHDGALYIAMRYVEGDDLRTLVRHEGALAPARAAAIVAQIGAALDAAHRSGIVHRDVKPANVLLGDGDHAYLTDFGLTKRVASHTGTSRTGGWVGTLGYVAPEQIRGAPVDARADVYALGCVLFHALTGAAPYGRDSDEATLWAHLNEPPPPVHGLTPEVPEAFDAVVARALAKAPEDRFASAGDLGRAAVAAARGEAYTAPPQSVARGAAAGGARAARQEAPTRTAGPAPATRVDAVGARRPGVDDGTATPADADLAAGRRRRGRRLLMPAAVLAALLVAAAVLALSRTGGDPKDGGARARPARAPRGAPAAKAFPVGNRPNDVVVAGGRAWATSYGEGRLSTIALDSNEVGELALADQRGTASIAAGYGSLWVANAERQQVTRIRLPSMKADPPIPLPPGRVVAISVGAHGVWVGSRGAQNVNNVVRIDPRSNRIVKQLGVAQGVQDLSAGEGGVWVVERNRQFVTRIRARDGRRTRIGLSRGLQAIEVGAGAVWVSNEDAGLVSRIDPASEGHAEVKVGSQPQGIGIGGGAVWVANKLDGTVTRIDPRTVRVTGAPVAVGLNPFAVAVRGPRVFVTNLGDGTVSRIAPRAR